MVIQFPGSRYDFEIRTDSYRRCSTFSVRAISKDNRRYSSINNLNAVLSELGVNADNPKYEDSLWELGTKEADRLIDVMAVRLSSPRFVRYLECRLDDDRRCGEWANRLRNRAV